ncbi:hypothetical protein M639_11170 [Listeria monocytogenes]|uniref:hypothetical protein n=1 Tax=Listeria monocytogenes TaxID=1639 RepID=UPI0003590F9A|nr:hypothetical protein [Listeria monocytogenes]AGR09928.1 hypothetical protein M639_11170 [Listeria monocytogenes]
MQTIDRNEIAKDINAKISGLGRNIRTNWELGFEEGQVITLEKQESWTDGGDFTVCNDCPWNIILKLKTKHLATL